MDVTVVLGAILAAVKFGLFHEAGHRLKSEFSCSHVDLSGTSTALLADPTVQNAGQRTIELTMVTLCGRRWPHRGQPGEYRGLYLKR